MSPGHFTSALLFSLLIVLIAVAPGGDGQSSDSSANCCSRLGIPSECHFLCGVGSAGFWTIRRWKCTHKYYAQVATCEVNDAFNYVKLFGQGLTQKIKSGFDKLSQSLREKLSSAAKFASATIAELRQVPQDLLCALKDSLPGMTSLQFGGLVQRFKMFTAQNLRSLVAKVNLGAFFDNVNTLAGEDWDQEQLAALIKGAFRKFGDNVQLWSKDVFAILKQLLAGLESGELAQITSDKFNEVTKYLCSVRFSGDQQKALLVPAKAAYGEVYTWTEGVVTRLCRLIEALPVEDILQLSSKVVAKLINTIANVAEFSYPHARALLTKVKAEIGPDINKWSVAQLQKLGKLVKDLDVKNLKQLLSQQFKALLSELGKIQWSPARARQLAKKAIAFLGNPETWTAANLKDMGNIVASLLPSEIRQVANAVLKSGLKAFKNVDLDIDQAQEIVNKIKTELSQQLQNINKDDLVSLAKAIDGFLASDIGRMTQVVVFAAFPELRIAKQVALPIIRELIKIYEKDSSNQKNIGMLGNVATGLSRSELDDTTIESIVNNLDKIGAIPWDKTQVIELAKKIRGRWGSMNDTENSDSDSPDWGFLNLKKLGRVALGIAKEELRDLPIRGIEDAIEVLGKQKEWDRGQITMVLTRLREYWQMEDLDFSNFTELDINSLGSFVQGLTQGELDQLPDRVLLIAIRRLGEETGIPEDKLKARAFQAVEYFKKQTGVDVLNATHIQDMGNLVAGLSRKTLNIISKEAFVQNLYNIARSKGFDEKKLRELAKLAKEHFDQSDVGKWLGNQWRDLGPAIVGLDPSDLRLIGLEALEEIIDDLGKLTFTKAQAEALISAAKNAYKESDVSKWSGERLRELGSLARGLSVNDILRTTKEGFEEAVGVWGKQLNVDLDNLKAMAAIAKQHLVKGNASRFTAANLKKLGRVVLGLEPSDLEKLQLDNIDIIAALGKWKGWTQAQLEKLKPKVKEYLAKNGVEDVYMSLGQLSTVLTRQDIAKIRKKSFNLAVKQLGELDWTDDQMKAILDKAKVTWEASVDTWDKARISELGNTLKGLSYADIPKLSITVVDAIKPEVIGSMSSGQLKSFTPAQYRAMETPQVEAISMAQRSELTAEQQSAIKGVIDSDPIEADPWGPDCSGKTCSGSVHVSVSLLSVLGMLLSAVALSW